MLRVVDPINLSRREGKYCYNSGHGFLHATDDDDEVLLVGSEDVERDDVVYSY